MINTLETLHEKLKELAGQERSTHYEIPSLWINPETGSGKKEPVSPFVFYRDRVSEILSAPDETPPRLSSTGEWSAHAVVYNMFTRLTTAFDHNGNGKLDLPINADGFRETGTFLKAIVLLPYMKHLGCNTIHFLPITAIGRDGNKGTLGSPYAIRNPYRVDENLSELILGLDVETEFAAFVQAAHRLGIRVVLEFVFRTASKDSDWIPDHPNWFYWIDANVPDRDGHPEHGLVYGSPVFGNEELRMIHMRVKRNDMSSLPPPGLEYRKLFTDPPVKVEYIDGKFIGETKDGKKVRIPGAFADWPPVDVQPPWDDVTYLKLYDDTRFNYIAYNTIRMYDSRLATKGNENRGLWNTILNVIPHYQKRFNVDGVMIDMGHALPAGLKQTLVERARRLNPDFAFWEENFDISHKSRQEGYNAAVGFLPFDEYQPAKLKAFCTERATQGTPIPFFATPENHNTPRAATRKGGLVYSKMALVINNFLPGIPYIHQGYELGEQLPVNTGLDFTPEEIERIPSHVLPLFSEGQICWLHETEFTSLIHRVATMRKEWSSAIVDLTAHSFHILPTSHENILAFIRASKDEQLKVAVVVNMNCTESITARLVLPSSTGLFYDRLNDRELQLKDGVLEHCFAPGECMIGTV